MLRVCFVVVLNVLFLKKKYLKFIVIIVFYNVYVCILLCNMYIFDF